MGYRPPPALVHLLAWNLSRTLRYRRVHAGRLRAAIAASPTGSVIFCLWHQSLFPMVAGHHHQRIAALTSLSGDGTIIATYMAGIGLRPIRGSSSRGGLRAAREMIAAVSEGWHAAITVDGPRGPFKEVKPGPFEIARRSGAPIVPVAVRASREVHFKRSWDRFRLPLLGSRLALVYGSPLSVPPEYPTPAESATRCRALACQLHDLEAEAGRLVGRRDLYPGAATCAWMDRGVGDQDVR